MKIRFWGVRGSIPSPIKGVGIREKIRKALHYASPADVLDDESVDRFLNTLPFSLTHTYGGNTTCLEIRTRNNDVIIVDAGTGMRELGNLLVAEGFTEHARKEAAIVMTHSHWDHIQGMPFFIPFYIPGNTFHVHAVSEDMKSRLEYQQSFRHFPVPFELLGQNMVFHQHQEDEQWELFGLKIKQKAMRHPGGSYSYTFTEGDHKFVFATDAEFRLEDMDRIEEYIEYFRDADILVFDTQYTFEEQLQKIDYGHSSASIATDMALKANVKKLVLFHHDPTYDDDKLDQVYLRALRYKEMMDTRGDSEMEILIAYEGLEMFLG